MIFPARTGFRIRMCPAHCALRGIVLFRIGLVTKFSDGFAGGILLGVHLRVLLDSQFGPIGPFEHCRRRRLWFTPQSPGQVLSEVIDTDMTANRPEAQAPDCAVRSPTGIMPTLYRHWWDGSMPIPFLNCQRFMKSSLRRSLFHPRTATVPACLSNPSRRTHWQGQSQALCLVLTQVRLSYCQF